MSLTPMMSQFHSIKSQYPDAILFFRLGDFYEMFGDDAKKASRILEITLTSRDAGKNQRIPMCGVPYHAVDPYLDKLVKSGCKVAICEQIGDPAKSKGVVKREVTKVLTPGTFLEGTQDGNCNVFLAAVAPYRNGFGLAHVDVSTGEFLTVQIESWRETVDELRRLRVSELITAADFTMQDEIGDIGELHCSLGTLPAASFKPQQAEQRLLEHFQIASLEGFGVTSPAAIAAAGAVIQYIQENRKAALPHISTVFEYSLAGHLNIDSASSRNLELVQTLRDGTRSGSLLGILDSTVTSMGARKLRGWLEKPAFDIEVIHERQDAVQVFVEDPPMMMELRQALGSVSDVERLLSKLCSGSGNARDLTALKHSLQALEPVKSLLAPVKTKLICHSLEQIDPLPQLTNLIERAIVADPPVVVKEGGLIKQGYDAALDQLRETSRTGKDWISRLEQTERQTTGIKSLKVGYNRVFGYYIEVTKTHIAKVPKHYMRKQTLTNAERFVTPDLKERESTILGAEEKIVQLEYDLFQEIRQGLHEHIDAIRKTAAAVAVLDAMHSLAKVAVERNYVRPTMDMSESLVIEDGRHPVVEGMRAGFVPNDVTFDEQLRQIILTGPNMAGKSTYLRQTALIVIMAQMGSYVPAKRCVLGLVDRLFTRIGASDDLSTGQSTFMMECIETANLVHNASARSLVVLDELGRGTSTFDGMAIAQAVIEFIHNKVGCRTLFSTHYHELAKLEGTLTKLATFQMMVEEKDGSVYFLHKVQPGNADKSYGINVARMAGMPKSIVKRARDLLYKLEASQQRPVQMDLIHLMRHQEPGQSIAEKQQPNKTNAGEAALLAKLDAVNADELTPMQALSLIHTWQQQYCTGGDKEQ